MGVIIAWSFNCRRARLYGYQFWEAPLDVFTGTLCYFWSLL